MTDIRKTGTKYTKFCQINVKSQTGIAPASIIGNGDGQTGRDLILVAEFLRVGSVIEIFQHGKLTANNGTAGTPNLTFNNSTLITNTAILPNNLSNSNYEARYFIVVSEITETEISFLIELRSLIVTSQFTASASRQIDAEVTITKASQYVIDILYNFNNSSGIIENHMTIISVSY